MEKILQQNPALACAHSSLAGNISAWVSGYSGRPSLNHSYCRGAGCPKTTGIVHRLHSMANHFTREITCVWRLCNCSLVGKKRLRYYVYAISLLKLLTWEGVKFQNVRVRPPPVRRKPHKNHKSRSFIFKIWHLKTLSAVHWARAKFRLKKIFAALKPSKMWSETARNFWPLGKVANATLLLVQGNLQFEKEKLFVKYRGSNVTFIWWIKTICLS